MIRIYTLLFFLFGSFSGFANVNNSCSQDYIELELKFEHAEAVYQDGHIDKALKLYLELDSLIQYSYPELSKYQKVSFIAKICMSFQAIRDTKQGIAIFERNLDYVESNMDPDDYELAKFYEAGGALYEYMKDYENAKYYLFSALNILKNYPGESDIYLHLAWYHYTIEKNNMAVEYFNISLDEFNHSDKSHSNIRELMRRYLMTTGALIRIRDYGAALNNLKKAEDLNKILKDDHREFYLNVKFAEYFLTIQDHEQALVYLSREIPESQKNKILVSTYHFYTAYAKYQTEDYLGAIEFYSKSLNRDLKDAADGKALRVRDIAENYKQIGYCYHELCDYSTAIEKFELSVSYLDDSDSYHTTLAETYGAMSDAYLEMSELDKSLEYNRLALDMHDEDLVGVMDCNLKTSKIYLEYFEESNDYKFVDTIMHLMDKNDLLINNIRHDQRFYEESTERESLIKIIYSESLEVLNFLNRFDKRGHIINKIFLYMEGIKSYKLKQELKDSEGLVKYGVPEIIIDTDASFKKNISELQKEIYKIERDSSLDAGLTVKVLELENLKKDYVAFLKNVETEHSSYYEFKYNHSTIELDYLQEELSSTDAILEYFVTDHSFYVLSITANDTKYYDIDKPDNWDELIHEYSTSVSDPRYLHQDSINLNYRMFTNSASKIYDIVFKEILLDLDKSVNTLIIVPDDDLHFIQFDNLLSSPAQSEVDFKNLDYLVYDFKISRASSAYIYSQLKQKKRTNKTLSYLGIAPSYQDGKVAFVDSLEEDRKFKQEYYNDLVTRGSVVDLPIARQSVSTIAKIMDGMSIIGKDATKFSFMDNVDEANIFHFAGHAIVDVDDPEFSQLLFPYEEIDSQLYATDIYDIALNLDLAVLSACNTGNGKFDSGEGVMSLSRAFEFAGCSSIVLSLWNIPDVQTAELDLLFFEKIHKGQRVDQALRDSKLTFLESSSFNTAHPFYWSGLTASGKMEPVKKCSLLDQFCNFLMSI